MLRDAFPTTGPFSPSDRSMTAVDAESGERVYFRDFQTMTAYHEGISRLERVEWLVVGEAGTP